MFCYLAMANGHGRLYVQTIAEVEPYSLVRVCQNLTANASNASGATGAAALLNASAVDVASVDGGTQECLGTLLYRWQWATAKVRVVPLDPPFFWAKYVAWFVSTSLTLYILCVPLAGAKIRATVRAPPRLSPARSMRGGSPGHADLRALGQLDDDLCGVRAPLMHEVEQACQVTHLARAPRLSTARALTRRPHSQVLRGLHPYRLRRQSLQHRALHHLPRGLAAPPPPAPFWPTARAHPAPPRAARGRDRLKYVYTINISIMYNTITKSNSIFFNSGRGARRPTGCSASCSGC